MGKKRDFKTTLEHWKFKYKLSILNEKTLEEVLRIRLSRLTSTARWRWSWYSF